MAAITLIRPNASVASPGILMPSPLLGRQKLKPWVWLPHAVTYGASAPPALPATLSPIQGNRFLVPDREHIVWYYVPVGVDLISFYAGRQGSFMAVFVRAPLQMQDAE